MRRKFMTGKLKQSSHFGSRRAGVLVFVLAIFVLLAGGYTLAAEEQAKASLARYRVFALRHIPAEKGKEYLRQTQLGTVSQLPGANMLLVTGSPRQLIKASAILRLVDAEEQFVIKEIFPASLANNLPSNEQIAARVGDVIIGTFSEPPVGATGTKAIIDIHNDAVITIAPVDQLEGIVSAVNSLLLEQQPELLRVTNNEQSPAAKEQPATEGEQLRANDEFFNKLLESVAEAEQRAAQEAGRPGEPNVVIAAPEVNVPSGPAEAVETPAHRVEAELLRAAQFAAILERLEAIEARLKAEPAATEALVEVEQPNDVVIGQPNDVGIGQPNEVVIEQPNEVAEPVPRAPYEPEAIPDGNDVLKLNLPPDLTIIEFLDFMAKNLHLTYLYDPAKIKGNVAIKLEGKFAGDVKRKDLYPLLESVLQFNGFVMTRGKGNILRVVPKAEADTADAPFVRPEVERPEYGNVIVTRVFKLKHVDTATALALLTNMQLGLTIRQVPEAGELIVIGYAYRMPRIEEVLEVVDKPGPAKKFEFRQLKFTMAQTLAPKVKTLAEQLGTISVTVSAAAAAPAPAAVTRNPGESAAAFRARQIAARRGVAARPAPAAGAPAAKPTVYLDADERTNRILMIGLEEQLEIVNTLIDSLDVKQTDLRTLRYIEIQHVDAEEVREKLAELGIISAAGAAPGAPGRPAGPAAKGGMPAGAAATVSTGEALVEEPQVIIIESTNALLVNATAEQHAQIALIIGHVDRETLEITVPYVVYPLENHDPLELSDVLNQLVRETVTGKDAKGAKIETTTRKIEEDIYIIPDPKTYSLIVYASKKNQQWLGSLIKQLDEYRPQVLLDVTLVEITKNDAFTLDLDVISSFPDLIESSVFTSAFITDFSAGKRQHYIDLQSQKGNATGFYGDKHIQVLLNAVQTKSYGRILARPKLLVNDNEEGTITTERTTTIAREKTDIIPGSASSLTTSATSISFDTFTEGIDLAITPHISQGDQLQLKILMKRTDFGDLTKTYSIQSSGGTKTGPIPPDLLSSNVETVVTVPDGKTIILGGLEKLNQTKGGTKVPLLGDIPLVGGLFRKTSNTDTQSRLYVFVKAHILRPGEEFEGLSDVEVVSAKNREKFQKYETEMQKYEDWPGIKPTPLNPLRILETD